MITCSKCGAMIEGNPMTCPKCGAQIVQDAEQPMDSYSSTDSGEDNLIGSKTAENSNAEKTIIVQHKDIFVRILLIILVGCVGYLVVSRFREKTQLFVQILLCLHVMTVLLLLQIHTVQSRQF